MYKFLFAKISHVVNYEFIHLWDIGGGMWRFMYHRYLEVLVNNFTIIIGVKEERFDWTGINISLLCNWYQPSLIPVI